MSLIIIGVIVVVLCNIGIIIITMDQKHQIDTLKTEIKHLKNIR